MMKCVCNLNSKQSTNHKLESNCAPYELISILFFIFEHIRVFSSVTLRGFVVVMVWDWVVVVVDGGR